MDETQGTSWFPGSFVIFKRRGATSLWSEPPLPLSQPLPLHDIYGNGKLGFVLEISQYSCKIFVDDIIGWVDKVDIYTA